MNTQNKMMSPEQRGQELAVALRDRQTMVKDLLAGTGTSVERFNRVFAIAIASNPKLRDCSLKSKLRSAMIVAQLDLEIDSNMGEVYLIPYNSYDQDLRRKALECTVQVGYKGFIKLAHQSEQISMVYAHVVHAADHFDYSYGIEKKLEHAPHRDKDHGKLTAAYAVVKYKDKTVDFIVMEAHEIEKYRSKSMGATKADSPWIQWEESMWAKTALKKLCRVLPKSPRMSAAIGVDDHAEIGKPQVGPVDIGEAKVTAAYVEPEPEKAHEPKEPGFHEPTPETKAQAEEYIDEAEKAKDKCRKHIMALCRELGYSDQARHEYCRMKYGEKSIKELPLETLRDFAAILQDCKVDPGAREEFEIAVGEAVLK